MNFKWTSINLFIVKFLVSLLIIGIIIGFFVYYNEPDLVKESINHELSYLGDVLSNTRQNNFINHLILFSVAMFFSLIIIGLPIILFYYFYEGLSFGFFLASLFDYNGFEGLFFGVIFGIINKLILYLVLIYLLLFSFHYSKKMIRAIKNKEFKIYEYVATQIFKNIFIMIIILISNTFIFFFGNKILAYFLFLL